MRTVESERIRQREKYHRLYKGKKKKTPEYTRKSNANWRNKFPEKFAAANAIRMMKRPVGKHFHHWSYLPEHRKDVIEITREDHYVAHRYLVYDQERMMYRAIDNVLLDTKEAHLAYIKNKIKYYGN